MSKYDQPSNYTSIIPWPVYLGLQNKWQQDLFENDRDWVKRIQLHLTSHRSIGRHRHRQQAQRRENQHQRHNLHSHIPRPLRAPCGPGGISRPVSPLASSLDPPQKSRLSPASVGRNDVIFPGFHLFIEELHLVPVINFVVLDTVDELAGQLLLDDFDCLSRKFIGIVDGGLGVRSTADNLK